MPSPMSQSMAFAVLGASRAMKTADLRAQFYRKAEELKEHPAFIEDLRTAFVTVTGYDAAPEWPKPPAP